MAGSSVLWPQSYWVGVGGAAEATPPPLRAELATMAAVTAIVERSRVNRCERVSSMGNLSVVSLGVLI